MRGHRWMQLDWGRVLLCLVVLNLGVGVEVAQGAEGDVTEVGLAKVDITPSFPVRLNGYGSRSEEAVDVDARIHARALAIGSDAEGVKLIVTVDNCAVIASITEKIFEKLHDQMGLLRENLVVSSTHTHSAPALTGAIVAIFGKDMPPEHQRNVDRYTRELIDQVVAVSLEAIANRAPSKLSWSRGEVGFGANRREMKNGEWVGFNGNPDGPVDHGLPVMFVHGVDGKLRGIFTSYACHCTTTGGGANSIHGDWAGFAADRMEVDHAGIVALVAIGCGADQNPNPRGELAMSKQYGGDLADEVKRLLKAESRPLPVNLDARLMRVDLPLEKLPTRAEFEAIANGSNWRVAYCAQRQLDRLDRGEKLKTHVEDYPVAVWTFGDELAMVFLGGEVVVDYALRLYKEFDQDRLWINGYSNDVPCYIPSKRILREGGYEADGSMMWYDQPTRFSPGVEDLVVDTVQRLMPHTFYAGAKRAMFPMAKSPAEALASMSLHEDMRIELVASEPQIVDPVAIDFGADGRLWVLEQPDYPLGMDDELRFGGRVSVLEDRDGDGHYETSKVFADGLPFPTGLKLWRDGVIVCAAPEILFLRDTNNDGRADERRVLMSNFPTYNYHARVNSPRWGLDNWLYFANGLAAREVNNEMLDTKLNVSKRDFRMNADTGVVEPVSGLAQFGRIRDDWGNWFGVQNSFALFHYPINERYVQRNPDYPPPDPKIYVPNDGLARASVYPVGEGTYRATRADHLNHITSACGAEIYRDRLLGEMFAGNSFTCEPAHNLVTRRILDAKGSTFVGRRAEEETASEFLATGDNWFRPVQARTGPDGAVWVVDMYRWVIEHPDYMPPDQLALLNVREGAKHGRIYRIFPKGASPRGAMGLAKLSTEALAAAVDSPNGVVRDTAHQLLVERGDRAAVGGLESILRGSALAESRVQALCTLEGLGAVEATTVLAALGDRHAQVRRQGVRIAEKFWLDSPAVGKMVLDLADDQDAQLAMQLAYSLGEWGADRAGEALGKVAVKHGSDAYIRSAVMSSAGLHLGALIEAVVGSNDLKMMGAYGGALLEAAVVQDDWAAVERLMGEARVAGGAVGYKFGVSFYETIKRRGLSLDGLARGDVKGGRDKHVGRAVKDLQGLMEDAWIVSMDENATVSDRIEGVKLLGAGGNLEGGQVKALGRLLGDGDGRVRAATVDALGQLNSSAAANLLLSQWSGYMPDLRSRVGERFLARSGWTAILLDRLESDPTLAMGLGASLKERLVNHSNVAIRNRARKILGAAAVERETVLARYAAAGEMAGDVQRGGELFSQVCAVCHQVGDVGLPIGPNLAEVTNRSAEAMLIAILDPNRVMDPKFESFTVMLKDGRAMAGRLTDESAGAITLMGLDGVSHSLRRGEIESLMAAGRSLMPEGLEEAITVQQMADLLAYVKELGPRPKEVAGNTPRVIKPDAIDTFELGAAVCEIYGDQVTYDSANESIVGFDGEQDRLVWRLDVRRGGRYSIELEWASGTEQPWNKFVLSALGGQWASEVPTSSSWETYRRQYIGFVTLKAGDEVVSLESAGRVRGELMRLKAVRLIWAPKRARRPSNPDEVVR